MKTLFCCTLAVLMALSGPAPAVELWRSLRLFDGRCTLQTWVYRVAHNVAAGHILRMRRASARLVDLDALDREPGFVDGEAHADRQHLVSRLLDRSYRLKPLDRQVILLYLEGEPAAYIAEITGLRGQHRH